ncbi:unnamed protein product [Rotaria sp. Silwood2]|nr:unnamed protein product [Rotaria sp. Silwood2]CAF3161157.1 unnamed protein product [Rotaria sp. Silwood2]CAF3960819.1 unnamed protein product [Rotaria sp. Silwood2]CAF3971647.1 unnamed protein product [Rotaria sp. Silwood2]
MQIPQLLITNTQISNLEGFLCNGSIYLLSPRRINDGYIDCLSGEDERNQHYEMIQPYRYRCLDPLIRQYVSYQQLGNEIEECSDGSDELSDELHWPFFRCEFEDEYACWVLRGTGLDNNDRIKDVRLLFHRHCDSIWDTRDGRDEKNCSQWICALGMYQCQGTGQCINRTQLCDGEFDCDNGEDELNCSITKLHWSLEDQCNNSREHFCITFEFLSNQTLYRPCIDYSKTGDGFIDCIGGRDERNVFSCSDHRMLGDRFLCDNATKCLGHTVICNGINECFDQTDELICFWNRYPCRMGQFACLNDSSCHNSRCKSNQTCSKNEHLFWCPNSKNALETTYRSSKIRRLSNYNSFCNSFSLAFTPPTTILRATCSGNKLNFDFHGFCNRGFFLMTGNDTQPSCFCPPSFYGNQCQFNRRRITIRIRFDRRHRSDIPPVLHILVFLLYNETLIIDHQRFVDVDQDFPPKHNAYLLYSRPNLTGNYSVRFEAYHSLELVSIWEYSINTIGYLPVFRLAKILRFPDRSLPWLCLNNLCRNNGTCYVIVNQNPNQYLCLCQHGWKGKLCNESLEENNCALHALVRSENVCVCPHGYLPPHCFVRNTICDQKYSTCTSDEICSPFSVLPPHGYTCLCNGSKTCKAQESILVLNQQKTNEQALLLQLLKFSSDYPRLRQQILVSKSTDFPVLGLINLRDTRNKRSVPEMGLLYTFEPQTVFVAIHLSILYINCSNTLRNLSIDLDLQPLQCTEIFEHPSAKIFHTFCRRSDYRPCFYTKNYVCYCSEKTNRSECMSYEQRNMDCSYCINQGYCIQGNLQNRSDFACVCPKCVSGDLCQFAFSRFSINFEMLIEQIRGDYAHLIGPMIFFFVGLIFNGLGIVTFKQQQARKVGTGLYLLANGIISQFVLVLLLARITYLVLARQITINAVANKILCKILPYLMTAFSNTSMWLMTFVTVERALIVTWPTRFRLFRTPRCAIILSTITFMGLFSSLYAYVIEYKLVIHPDYVYASCVREIPLDRKIIVQYTSLAHQIIPFLINFIAGMTVIINIGRSKATSHHISTCNTIVEQIRQRADLLTIVDSQDNRSPE